MKENATGHGGKIPGESIAWRLLMHELTVPSNNFARNQKDGHGEYGGMHWDCCTKCNGAAACPLIHAVRLTNGIDWRMLPTTNQVGSSDAASPVLVARCRKGVPNGHFSSSESTGPGNRIVGRTPHHAGPMAGLDLAVSDQYPVIILRWRSFTKIGWLRPPRGTFRCRGGRSLTRYEEDFNRTAPGQPGRRNVSSTAICPHTEIFAIACNARSTTVPARMPGCRRPRQWVRPGPVRPQRNPFPACQPGKRPEPCRTLRD